MLLRVCDKPYSGTRPEAESCFKSATGTIALETDKQIKDAVIHSSQTALRIKCYKKVLFSVIFVEY